MFNILGRIRLRASQEATASHSRGSQHFFQRINTPPFPFSGGSSEGRHMHSRSPDGTEGGAGPEGPVSRAQGKKGLVGRKAHPKPVEA